MVEEQHTTTQAVTTDGRKRLRLVFLVAILAGLFAVGSYYDVTEHINAAMIRERVVDAGPWGWILYVAIFSGGEFLHIPGLIFVAGGILAYGKLTGFVLAFIASLISVGFSFVVVRSIGGTQLERAKNPTLQKALAQLERHPIRTVLVLRLFLFLSPALNYALALTRISFRDYLIGSTLGLIAPIAAAAYFFDWLIANFL